MKTKLKILGNEGRRKKEGIAREQGEKEERGLGSEMEERGEG